MLKYTSKDLYLPFYILLLHYHPSYQFEVASNFFSKLQDVLKISIAKLYNPMTRDLFSDKLGDFALFKIVT